MSDHSSLAKNLSSIASYYQKVDMQWLSRLSRLQTEISAMYDQSGLIKLQQKINNPVKDAIEMHYDISEICLKQIVALIRLYKKAANEDAIYRLKKHELLCLSKNALANNQIDIDSATGKIKLELEKIQTELASA
jgi:hypothetical protein